MFAKVVLITFAFMHTASAAALVIRPPDITICGLLGPGCITLPIESGVCSNLAGGLTSVTVLGAECAFFSMSGCEGDLNDGWFPGSGSYECTVPE
ncbi:hypothetical protein BDP27DRAFT_1426924 [Rhodocollybia butyracea]|uniref:Uncharacterized protein n=1 Tax=Rhodocollybia butyracea TaxID=206335 RepID=A0A9P5PHQ6_9AGAR|nr:hypothetical protein BDP27DRAFT_1426924 [Rhodocollybia butyracea]